MKAVKVAAIVLSINGFILWKDTTNAFWSVCLQPGSNLHLAIRNWSPTSRRAEFEADEYQFCSDGSIVVAIYPVNLAL